MSAPAVLLGIPYDASSSFLRGAAQAPEAIRQALASEAGNPWAERLVKTACPEVLEDRGDLALPATGESRALIERTIAELAVARRRFIALGGDHSITYPIVKGLAATYAPPSRSLQAAEAGCSACAVREC